MRTRSWLGLWMWLAAVALAGGATVQIQTVHFTGRTNNRPILITPVTAPAIGAGGTHFVVGPSLTVQPTNGVVTTNLVTGYYRLAFDGLAGSLTIWVPDEAGTYNAAALVTDSVAVGSTNTLGVSQLVAGSGVSLSPTNGRGVVTVSIAADAQIAGMLSASNLVIRGPTLSNKVFGLVNNGESLWVTGEGGYWMLSVGYRDGDITRVNGTLTADQIILGEGQQDSIMDGGARISGVAMTNNWVYADGAKIGATGTNVIADGGSSINGVRMTNGWLWATNIIVTNLIATNIVRAHGGAGSYAEIGTSGHPFVNGSSSLYLMAGRTSYYMLGQNFLRGRSACRFEWSTNAAHQTPDLFLYRAGAGTLGVSNSVMVWSNVVIKASGDGVIDRTPVSGAAQFFSATNSESGNMAEMYVQDEAGNETLISPHATDAPPELYDRAAGEVTDYIVREANPFVGTLHWVNIRRMARLTELNTMAILYLAGQTNAANSNALARLKSMPAGKRQVIASESYAQYNARTGAKLEVLDWQAVQDKNQAEYDAERARLAAERESALATNAVLTAEGRTNELMVVPDVPPTRDVRKLAPTWLQSRETIEKR